MAKVLVIFGAVNLGAVSMNDWELDYGKNTVRKLLCSTGCLYCTGLTLDHHGTHSAGSVLAISKAVQVNT